MSSAGSWRGRRVLVTGHTGFKGSWLALWLHRLGAAVTGFALPPPTSPSLFEMARVGELVESVIGDVRDLEAVTAAMTAARPEVVFHLAAQPLVSRSYEQPVEAFAINLLGTVHVLEAARLARGVRAVVCVTTDKCYENREWVWPYRESDPMGGHDPYSSSKGCAELAVAAYRSSYFGEAGALQLASVRAGNVIGGGDFARDRLVPDLVRAFERGEAPVVRSPGSVRPWQHVLEALGAYLMIAERLLTPVSGASTAWNIGPSAEDARPVSWMVDSLREAWGGGDSAIAFTGARIHEAGTLRLDISKAHAELGWRPSLPLGQALEWTAEWSKAVGASEDPRAVTLRQIQAYAKLAAGVGVPQCGSN